jgi:hypothetical protein
MNPVNITRVTSGIGDGAAAGNDITITGIKVGDHIVAAYHMPGLDASAGKIPKANLTDECTITADDTVQCSSTDTNGTNEQLWVWWVTASDAP